MVQWQIQIVVFIQAASQVKLTICMRINQDEFAESINIGAEHYKIYDKAYGEIKI